MDILELTYDLKKRTEGVKIPIGGDAYLLIAEHGTPAFWEAYRKRREALSKEDELTAEQSQEAFANAIADTVLIGWDGITEGGEVVEYSKAKAAEWLLDPAKEPLFAMVISESKKFENFKADRLEKEKKP